MIAAALVFAATFASDAPGDVIVVEPKELVALEEAGFGVADVAFSTKGATTNDKLAVDPGYDDVVKTIGRDLDELYKNDAKWGVGMKYTHRGFDRRWLTSADTRWELTAVVNRIDRRAFERTPARGCGELRLIYRLAYTTTTKSGPFSSRLPATLNIVFKIVDGAHDDCKAQALRLQHLERAADIAPIVQRWMLKSVEIDVQTSRWPSTIRPDLGGHADYVLRVFHIDPGAGRADRLIEAPLENTPDVDRIKRDKALKAELVGFLKDHTIDIDAGNVVVPDKFLAKRAVSVTPRGLARPQNRPWTRLLDDADLKALVSASSTSMQSAQAVARRLDGLTCMGCHQSRSLAGFHVVGNERAASVDALAVGISPHVEEDLPRRRAYVAALLNGAAVDDKRRPPDHEIDRGGFGDACGLGDAGFSAWTCAAGFTCTAVDDDVVGECMPSLSSPGSACMPGKVDFAHDRIAKAQEAACGGAMFCETVGVGFPGGMCAGPCDAVGAGEHSKCGGIAVLTPFNECLARGELFSECAKHSTPASLRACGKDDPCRPDYICAGASSSSSGGGVCLPPYFVLQMRVDGHPLKK